MSVYEAAKRHAWLMWGLLAIGTAFIIAMDQLVGHSDLAFAVVVFALLVSNMRILAFRCPNCGSNLFFRKYLVLPWPNRTCSRCGRPLATAR